MKLTKKTAAIMLAEIIERDGYWSDSVLEFNKQLVEKYGHTFMTETNNAARQGVK